MTAGNDELPDDLAGDRSARVSDRRRTARGTPDRRDRARSVPGPLVRGMRERFKISPRALAELLRCGATTIWRAETQGAPPWLPLALAGLGIARYGLEPGEAAAMIGLAPEAGAPTLGGGTPPSRVTQPGTTDVGDAELPSEAPPAS